jgi:hypothetical protein
VVDRTLLDLATRRGVCFDLFPDLAESFDSARSLKIEQILVKCRTVAPLGRVHPRYEQIDSGRVVSKGPNVGLLPRSLLLGDFGSHHNFSIGTAAEPLFLSHLLGEHTLAEAILDQDGLKPALASILNLSEDSVDVETFRKVFYRLAYGADPLPENAWWRAVLLGRCPRLEKKKQGANRTPLLHHVFGLTTALSLSVAGKAEVLPRCRLVGFAIDPIFEYDGVDPAPAAAAQSVLEDFAYDLLHFWAGNQHTGTTQ